MHPTTTTTGRAANWPTTQSTSKQAVSPLLGPVCWCVSAVLQTDLRQVFRPRESRSSRVKSSQPHTWTGYQRAADNRLASPRVTVPYRDRPQPTAKGLQHYPLVLSSLRRNKRPCCALLYSTAFVRLRQGEKPIDEIRTPYSVHPHPLGKSPRKSQIFNGKKSGGVESTSTTNTSTLRYAHPLLIVQIRIQI